MFWLVWKCRFVFCSQNYGLSLKVLKLEAILIRRWLLKFSFFINYKIKHTSLKIGIWCTSLWSWGWCDAMCLTSEELWSGLLPTIWGPTRRLIRRQLVSQIWSLDKWRGHHFARVSPEVLLTGIIGGHCTHDGFHMHHALLAYMVVFSQRKASNPSHLVSV